MKSTGWTRGLALLTVFAIGCSDMATSPLPLATRSKPIYIDIAGTWEVIGWEGHDSGTKVVISNVTNPDTVTGYVTYMSGEGRRMVFDAVRDGGDRSNVRWLGNINNNGQMMMVVLTLVKGHYKPATHMSMLMYLMGGYIDGFGLVRVKHTK